MCRSGFLTWCLQNQASRTLVSKRQVAVDTRGGADLIRIFYKVLQIRHGVAVRSAHSGRRCEETKERTAIEVLGSSCLCANSSSHSNFASEESSFTGPVVHSCFGGGICSWFLLGVSFCISPI